MNLLRHPVLRFVRLPALLAVLLLTMLPTVGRLQAIPARAGMHSAKVALCTVSGLQSVQLDPAPAHDTTPPGAPEHHQHDDCAYCPLLAGLLQPAIAPNPHLLVPDASELPHTRSAIHTVAIADTGLGARGPPDPIASIAA